MIQRLTKFKKFLSERYRANLNFRNIKVALNPSDIKKKNFPKVVP